MLARSALRSARSVGAPARNAASKTASVRRQFIPIATRSPRNLPPGHHSPACDVLIRPVRIGVFANALVPQRSASTNSPIAEGAASSWKTNALPVGATAFAIGTVAWYAYIAGRDVDAMTPAEEG